MHWFRGYLFNTQSGHQLAVVLENYLIQNHQLNQECSDEVLRAAQDVDTLLCNYDNRLKVLESARDETPKPQAVKEPLPDLASGVLPKTDYYNTELGAYSPDSKARNWYVGLANDPFDAAFPIATLHAPTTDDPRCEALAKRFAVVWNVCRNMSVEELEEIAAFGTIRNALDSAYNGNYFKARDHAQKAELQALNLGNDLAQARAERDKAEAENANLAATAAGLMAERDDARAAQVELSGQLEDARAELDWLKTDFQSVSAHLSLINYHQTEATKKVDRFAYPFLVLKRETSEETDTPTTAEPTEPTHYAPKPWTTEPVFAAQSENRQGDTSAVSEEANRA